MLSLKPPISFLRHVKLMSDLGRGMSPSELLFSWWRSRIMSSTYLTRHTFTQDGPNLVGNEVAFALSFTGPIPSAFRNEDGGGGS